MRSLSHLLEDEFEVSTAQDAAIALELIAREDFDVIISDQRMPGMSGVDLLREARQRAPRALRILLTGYSDLQAILRSVNDGEVYRFINKPWNVSELPRVVRDAAAIARHRPALRPAGAGPDAADSAAVLVLDDDPAAADAARAALPAAGGKVLHARSLGQAVAYLDALQIGVVVADTMLGGLDTGRLLCLLKQHRPLIVTVVRTSDPDAVEIAALINQGQIFRCLAKPTSTADLRVVLAAAVARHRQLRAAPEHAGRYAVEALPAPVVASLRGDVHRSMRPEPPETEADSALLASVAAGFDRLFAADEARSTI